MRLQKILFPLIMSILSLLSFIFVYILLITVPISPFYLRGLLFGIPTLCFAIITVLASKSVIQTATATLLTISMIILSLFASIGGLVCLAIEADSRQTSDVKTYERALSRLKGSYNPALSIFPETIPTQAEEVQFQYHPAAFQGGELLCLKYQVSQSVIKHYQTMLTRKAIRVYVASQVKIEETGVSASSLLLLDYETKGLPRDLVLYFTYSQPLQPSNWNHGTTAFVAMSQVRSELLFYYESW